MHGYGLLYIIVHVNSLHWNQNGCWIYKECVYYLVKKFYDFYVEYKFLLENESGQIEHLGYRNHN